MSDLLIVFLILGWTTALSMLCLVAFLSFRNDKLRKQRNDALSERDKALSENKRLNQELTKYKEND